MTKLINARLGFGPTLLGAGANVYHVPDAMGGGAFPDDPSAGETGSAEIAWRYNALTRSSRGGLGPTGIVAYGRTPSSRSVNGLDAQPAPKRMNLKKYRHILQGGVYSVNDLELAKELIVKVSPAGRAIFEAFDTFLEAEENKDPLQERFEFIFPGGGTYAQRKLDQDRVTSWGSAIAFEPGESVFALLHEIVHAMPLDQLPAELVRIPYRSPEREELSFEDRFVRYIESAYHDEAISGLAEVLLLDDLKRAKAPLPKDGEDGYVDHVRVMSTTYAEEGVDAYLDSELYIGRNHRINYNIGRLIEIAVVTLAEPETLRDVTISSVLAEGGITVTAPEGSKAAELLEQVRAVIIRPTLENIQALAMHAPRLLSYVTLDPEVMVARVKEFFEAYTKGKNPRRGRGFLGKRDVTVGGLRLLGKARAVYNDYIQQSMRPSPATEDRASDKSVEVTDEDRAIFDEFLGMIDEDSSGRDTRASIQRFDELREKAAEGDDDALRKMISIKKVITANEKEAMEALSAVEADRAKGDESLLFTEQDMTAAGLTEMEKRAHRLVDNTDRKYGDMDDLLTEQEQMAYQPGLDKISRYGKQQEKKAQAAAEEADRVTELKEKGALWAAAGLTKEEERVLIVLETENTLFTDLPKEDQKLFISAENKIEAVRRREEDRISAEAKKAEAASEKSFEARVYEREQLTEEEIALYEEYKKSGLSTKELHARFNDGDDHAGDLHDIATRVEESLSDLKFAIRANTLGPVMDEAGLTEEERDLFMAYDVEGNKRIDLYRRSKGGDADAKRTLDIVDRVEAAERRIKREAASPQHEFHSDFDDAPDALDALWNMTLDLAQEAGGARRDELIVRAEFLKREIDGMPESGKVSGIPSHQDLNARYEGTTDTIDGLSLAWNQVRDFHAAVVMRDKVKAAVVLETIGSEIADAFKGCMKDGDEESRLRSVEAIGIEVPGIMAAVGRIMRTAWKVGLPIKQAHGKQLSIVAQAMHTFLRSKSVKHDEFERTGDAILSSKAFGARAQADYVAFFFELLDGHRTKKLAKDWARFFLGSPMGVFFYRRLNASFDQAAKDWKGDYSGKGVMRAFEGHGFYHFFFPGTLRARDAGVYSERVKPALSSHAGYGNYGRLVSLGKKMHKGSVKEVSAELARIKARKETVDTLTIPVSGLPVEPSRIEGAIAYRGEGGAPCVDIALEGFYASLFRAWGLLISLPRFDRGTKQGMFGEVGKILFDTPLDLGDMTLHASLKLYYAHMLAVHGDIRDANEEASSHTWPADKIAQALPGEQFGADIGHEFPRERALASDMASLVKAQIALAAHDKGDHEEARQRVEYLHDYYKSIIHLRREGVYPDGMARAAEALSQNPAYRATAHSLLGLAIEHIAVYKNDEEIFPRALEWIIRSIDGAALPYDMREELMSDLVRTVIPEVRETSGYSPQEMQLRAYHVSRVNDVIYERGLSVHLARYEAAEALLYNRTADLIDEYGSMATSDAMMRGRFLQAAMRVNREVTFTKPELVAARNVETFERMDDDAAFQLDLADIFPEQLAAFDADAPVAEWNPTYVRRGVPEPSKALAKIKESLAFRCHSRESGNPETSTPGSRLFGRDDNQKQAIPPLAPLGRNDKRNFDTATKEGQYQNVLDVYAAFVRWEVDRAAAAQPHNREALENILDAYKQRIVEHGQINDVSDVTSLTKEDAHLVPKYATGLGRMFSRRELMALRETLELSSVAFAFDRLGSAFDERTELSAADENIVLAALDARGPHEAQAKRELFLYTLVHDSATLKLKRRAAYNLALSFKEEETIARLIDAYEKTGDAVAEARFYERITGFWQLTGQLPSDYYLMLLDGAGNGATDPLARLEELMRLNGTEATTLDLELRYGWQRYYERFIDDMQAYIDAGFKMASSIVHRDQVVQYIGPLKNDPERARNLVRKLKINHQDRVEEIEIAKANLPNIFLKQPPVVRFLLLSYFGELSGTERARLVQEMNELERAEGRAQTFMHFFEMAGLEKLGQTLSTLVGIVPEADRKVFARLQDKVPAGSAVEVRETIEREQGAKIEDLYEEFDDTPIASASIAEVYRARLKETGEEVYLKVIPRSKRRKIMETAARLRRVAANFEEHRDRFAVGLDVAGMLGWFADELEGQLNLRKEMHHAMQFESKYDALTPSYYSTTESVLVMRPLDGIKVTDLGESSPHRRTAARALAETGARAVLAGYYHADPHPGNIFVNKESGDVSWLDFGTMGRLDVEQRIQLMDFLFTLAVNDAHAQRMALENMGTPDASYDAEAFEAAIAKLGGIEVTERAARIIALAGEHRLFVRHQSSQVITNLLTLKGIAQQLDPAFDFVSVFNGLMPAAYAAAREGIDSVRPVAKEPTIQGKPDRGKTSAASVVPRERGRSSVHVRATALYGLIDTHMDVLEKKMGEDACADLDELADGLVDLAGSEPKSPTVKRGLVRVEDMLREHLGDAIVDAALA